MLFQITTAPKDSTYRSRVAAGMRLLDKRMPGWEKKINLQTLDIRSYRNCIIAQIFGDYVPEKLFGKDNIKQRISHGTTWGSNDNIDLAKLTAVWKRAIAKRLAQKIAATA